MKKIVTSIEFLKKKIGCNTYHIESAIVAITLIITALISQQWRIERIGVLAVFFTFGHVSVADRLEEKESIRQQKKWYKQDDESVWCYYKLERYYYAKEICWFAYFVLLGARSALVGVVVFLLYWPWRKAWRKYATPSTEKQS